MKFKVGQALLVVVPLLLLLWAVVVWGGPQAGTQPPGSAQVPAGTFVTTQRFEDYVRAHQREHELLTVQVDEAKKVVDLRLEAMNQLRDQIEKERGGYQPRAESTLTRERVEERLNKLEQAVSTEASARVTWTAAIALFFMIVTVALRFMPERRKGPPRS